MIKQIQHFDAFSPIFFSENIHVKFELCLVEKDIMQDEARGGDKTEQTSILH